jgi:HK97 family phage major capsid protein
MSDELLNEIKTLVTAQGAKISELETVIKSAPPIKELGNGVTVTSDPADRPFKSLADNLAAIKQYEVTKGRVEHARLTNPAIKATGASEGIPADGGFLIDPSLVNGLLMPMHEVGPFSRMARKLPTTSSYGWLNGVNETTRVDGGRWGGVLGYRLAEGATKQASQPKFRRINWELKKYAVLVYATDELLQDKALFSEIVRTGASEELAFMANADIVSGLGAAGPLGFMQSPALVTVAKTLNQTADTVSFQNIVDMWARLSTRSKSSAGTAWFVNADVMPQLDTLTLTAGTAGIPPRFVNYNDAGVMSIKGKPVYETEFNSTLGDLGDIVLADMSEYLLFEHSAGVQEAVSIHVQFLTDETVFRLVMRIDGQTALNAPLTPYKGSATQSPFVALAERA